MEDVRARHTLIGTQTGDSDVTQAMVSITRLLLRVHGLLLIIGSLAWLGLWKAVVVIYCSIKVL